MFVLHRFIILHNVVNSVLASRRGVGLLFPRAMLSLHQRVAAVEGAVLLTATQVAIAAAARTPAAVAGAGVEERSLEVHAALAVQAGEHAAQLLAEALSRHAVEEKVEGVVDIHQNEADGADQLLAAHLLQGGRGWGGEVVDGLRRGQQQPGEGDAQQHRCQAAVELMRRGRRRG